MKKKIFLRFLEKLNNKGKRFGGFNPVNMNKHSRDCFFDTRIQTAEDIFLMFSLILLALMYSKSSL